MTLEGIRELARHVRAFILQYNDIAHTFVML